MTQTCKVIKTVYQKLKKTPAVLTMLRPSGSGLRSKDRRDLDWQSEAYSGQRTKESRLTNRGDEDQGIVSSEEVCINNVGIQEVYMYKYTPKLVVALYIIAYSCRQKT